MIFGLFKRNRRPVEVEEVNEWDLYGQPVYDKENEEFSKLINDILEKLREIEILVKEMKQEEKNGDSTGNS